MSRVNELYLFFWQHGNSKSITRIGSEFCHALGLWRSHIVLIRLHCNRATGTDPGSNSICSLLSLKRQYH